MEAFIDGWADEWGATKKNGVPGLLVAWMGSVDGWLDHDLAEILIVSLSIPVIRSLTLEALKSLKLEDY